MIFNVVNKDICVGSIKIRAIASSSLLLVGDTKTIQLASAFDTPPESLIVGPLVSVAPKG
ncbi:spore gernimation protein GerPD [Peribacillus deserti]|uniref:Spore gernimation protein GerPD n=1 Tax=Peribacillus deserti TaxID=673318 RepID=A0A2N5M7W4_9BACI|nr:spore gernimation protein GerPD [Peribacillus deserti]PLT30425.1 spore gernimation protein GerPD [Peribacillus deserti]